MSLFDYVVNSVDKENSDKRHTSQGNKQGDDPLGEGEFPMFATVFVTSFFLRVFKNISVQTMMRSHLEEYVADEVRTNARHTLGILTQRMPLEESWRSLD